MLNLLPRWSLLVLTCALVACGDDSGGGGGDKCMDGEESVPGAKGDPCPQTGTECAAKGGKAIACCAGGSWALSAMGSVQCDCETTTSPVTCGGGSSSGMCGNGKIDSGEQCDGTMLGATSTCMAMNMGMGVLSCDPMTCRYDTSMCSGMGMTGGTGGGGTGG